MIVVQKLKSLRIRWKRTFKKSVEMANLAKNLKMVGPTLLLMTKIFAYLMLFCGNSLKKCLVRMIAATVAISSMDSLGLTRAPRTSSLKSSLNTMKMVSSLRKKKKN